MAKKIDDAVVEETTTAASTENVEVKAVGPKNETVEAKAKAKAKALSVNGDFEVKGKKYKLSDRCPAKVQFDGVVYSRKDLLTNKEVLQSLVIGESPFIKKV